MEAIGQRIKKIFEARGLKQAEFARRMDMRPQNLNSLFNSDSIATKTLERIALALDVPVGAFFADGPVETKVREEFIKDITNLKSLSDEFIATNQEERDKMLELLKKPFESKGVITRDQELELLHKQAQEYKSQIEELKRDKEDLKRDKEELRKLLEEARAGREGLKNDQITYGK